MQKITIYPEDVTPNKRSGSSNGRDYVIITQKAFLHTSGQRHPVLFSLSLENEVDAYPAGDYMLKDALTVGQYDSLAVERYPVLEPYKEQSQEKQATKAA